MAERRTSILRRFLTGRRRFARDEGGVTAIEFGLLALPFFAIIGAILETALVFISGQVLESALQDTSRLVRTGQAQAAGLNVNTFRDAVCDRTYGLFGDCSGIFIEVRPITNFASAAVTVPVNRTCVRNCNWTRTQTFNGGQGGDNASVMMAQAYFRWQPVIGFDLGFETLGDGRRLLGSVTVFRNEPF